MSDKKEVKDIVKQPIESFSIINTTTAFAVTVLTCIVLIGLFFVTNYWHVMMQVSMKRHESQMRCEIQKIETLVMLPVEKRKLEAAGHVKECFDINTEE